MSLNIKVTLPDSLKGSGKIAEVERLKSAILYEGGQALKKLLEEYMSQLGSSSRHSPPHWTPDGVHDPVVEGNTVSVPISIPGITRALHDIVINPVEAKTLAIPVNEAAYGISPRRYNVNHPKGSKGALFIPKGKDYLAKNEDGNLVVMYLLRNTVHQSQDRSLLPTDEAMNEAFSTAVHDAVQTIMEKT